MDGRAELVLLLFSLCSPWLGFVFSYINYDGFCSACQQPASSTVLLHWRSPGHLVTCSRLWPGGCPQLELHHLTLREEQEPPAPPGSFQPEFFSKTWFLGCSFEEAPRALCSLAQRLTPLSPLYPTLSDGLQPKNASKTRQDTKMQLFLV